MKRYTQLAGIIFVASVIVTAASQQQDPPVKDMTPAEEDAWATAAEATAEEACAGCHPIADITQRRHTWKEWNDEIGRMSSLGLSANDEQLTTIKLYLTRYYGAVNINTASAAEIAAVLGLSSKDAAAIVQYRKAHGNFADAAALAKVEGIDKSKIEAQPEALRFD